MTETITKILQTNPREALKQAMVLYNNALNTNDSEAMLASSVIILTANNILGRFEKTDELGEAFTQLHKRALNKEGEADCWHARGVAKFGLHQKLAASDFLNKSINLYKEHNEENPKIANCFNALGCVNMELGEYPKAYANFDECLDRISIEIDKVIFCKVVINIGKLQYQIGEYNESIENMKKALEVSEGLEDLFLRLTALSNCGLSLYEANKFKEAKIYLEEAANIAKEGGFYRIYLSILGELASINLKEGLLEEAFEQTKTGIQVANEYALFDLGYLYIIIPYLKCLNLFRKHKDVIQLGKKALKVSIELGASREELGILRELLIAYKAKKKTKEALKTASHIINLSDLIKENNKRHKVFSTRTQLAIKEREAKINNQAKVIQVIQASKRKLEQQNERLENEIAQRKLVEKKLVILNKEVASFATVASHDMKEPLRTIASYAQLIKRRIKTDESNTELINFIVDASKRMQVLLSDLISYTRVGTSKISHEKVNLNSLINIVASNLNTQIQEANVDVKVCEALPNVFTSKSLLNLVFQNLISNAIKYRSKERDPFIYIYHETQKDKHIIYVEDNGIGIEEEYYEAIFEPFRRLHSKADYDGVGIGLATVKRILTKKLKGNISISSIVGKGSKFIVELPIHE